MTSKQQDPFMEWVRATHISFSQTTNGYINLSEARVRELFNASRAHETQGKPAGFSFQHQPNCPVLSAAGDPKCTCTRLPTSGFATVGAPETECDEAHSLTVEFERLIDNTLVPNEPLDVYTSNSYRRVGLKRRYCEVLYATRDRSDGHPNFSNYALLDALVCAFNAMLARRQVKSTAPRVDCPHNECKRTPACGEHCQEPL